MSDIFSASDRQTFSRRIKEARIGDPSAQYEVAVMSANGVGVERDFRLAHIWAKKAAERGHATAQYLVGRSYLTGTGTPKDELLAVNWLVKAAERGSEKAAFRLAKLFESSQTALALRYCQQAADLSMADAQTLLAQYHLRGSYGMADQKLARVWFIRAASHGQIVAQHTLGQMYEHGLGGSVDLELARRMYRQASMQGMAASQIALFRLDSARGGRTPKSNDWRKRSKLPERRVSRDRWEEYADRGTPEDKYQLGVL